MEIPLSKACQEALDYGIDINLIECNLELTPEERVEENQRALDMINELKKGFNQLNGISQKYSSTSQ